MSDKQSLFWEKLGLYDQEAVKAKRIYQLLWSTIFILTWCPLIFCISFWGLGWSGKSFGSGLLRYSIISIGIVSALLTLIQSILGFRGRWLSYRAGAEQLRNMEWAYRAGVDAFKENRENQFDIHLENIVHSAEFPSNPLTLRNVWELLFTPSQLQLLPETSDEGENKKPLLEPLEEREYLHQRVWNQRRWYLGRARQNLKYFIAFQSGIILFSLISTVYNWYFGYSLFVASFCYSLNLALICSRDFQGCWNLFVRYIAASGSLRDIEDRYNLNKKNAEMEDHPRIFQQFVREIESVLISEVKHWYAAQGARNLMEN